LSFGAEGTLLVRGEHFILPVWRAFCSFRLQVRHDYGLGVMGPESAAGSLARPRNIFSGSMAMKVSVLRASIFFASLRISATLVCLRPSTFWSNPMTVRRLPSGTGLR